jgi:hypothetical protein
MSPRNTGGNSKIRQRVEAMNKPSVLPSYNREKSRQANTVMRYTNSLPNDQRDVNSGIPSHLRKSIDRLGLQNRNQVVVNGSK